MLTLLTFPAGFGEFSLSPFCTKAAWLLALSGEAWQRRDVTDPRGMPHGKLPVLLLADGTRIADSWAIRAFLEGRGAQFDEGLSQEDRHLAHLLERMAEEHLYFLLLADRWANDESWPAVRAGFFGSLPGPARRPVSWLVRRGILGALEGQGIGRMTPAEQLDRAEADLAVISARFGTRPFLMADRPTAADASVAPMIGGLRDGPVATPLTRRVRDDAILSAYVDRMRETVPILG